MLSSNPELDHRRAAARSHTRAGLGFVDEAGDIFRRYFHDVEIFTSPAP
jgi:hypothetical protein